MVGNERMEDAFWLVSLPSLAILLLQAAADDVIDLVVPVVSAAALDILQSMEHSA
jgi:hypothetical protein